MSIGKIAERTGTSVSAIRFYATEGLIPSTRNAGGHRQFHRSTIRRISFILIAQKMGYTLREIQDILHTLPHDRTPTKSDWARLSKQFTLDINQRIETLTGLRDRIDACIGCGCLSLKTCHIYNPKDSAQERGPGPRYLLGDTPPLPK